MSPVFQVSLLIDPRFPGGTSTSVAGELAALDRLGVVPAICPVLSGLLQRSTAFHPAIAAALCENRAVIFDASEPADCAIAVVHHPALFATLPAKPIRLRARRVVLVLHHPPFDGLGRVEYDLAAVLANIEESFGTAALVAPVGPAVRRQVARLDEVKGRLLDMDWSNLIDFAQWPLRDPPKVSRPLVIGRHSRPQISKFPDTLEEALLCYPDHLDLRVQMMGVPPDLAKRYGRIPANWELMPFGAMPPRAFLRGLDVFVYYHGQSWVEAFGLGILEAIATGVPAILPPHFEDLFGDAALYAHPAGVADRLEALAAAPETCRKHAEVARKSVANRFGIDRYAARLDAVLSDWRGSGGTAKPQGAPSRPSPAPRRIVFMTSNGIGLGHLTRCLAVAGRMPTGTQSAFFTHSQAFGLAVDAGYPTQFVPFHRVTGADPTRWNAALAEELGDFLDFFRPHVLVFDGNVPYEGLVAALQQRPAIKRVWIRRALWTPPDAEIRKRGARFDLVIEPGELCSRFDATSDGAGLPEVVRVDPILYLDRGDMLDRSEARRALGISDQALAVGVMLGAGNNYDLKTIHDLLIDALGTLPDVEIVECVSPVLHDVGGRDGVAVEPPAATATHRTVSLYPASQYAQAFDFMITSAGYNSFHEALLGTVPTVLVPNEAPEMDLQILRARYAQRTGCGEVLRATERVRIDEVLATMANPEARAEMRRRMARFPPAEGARQAADLIADFAYALRAVDGL